MANSAAQTTSPLRTPLTAVDVIIESGPNQILLVKRTTPPIGWALPGGFVDYGESLWQSAIREVQQETSLNIQLLHQLYTYSDPRRDSRCHAITTVFVGVAELPATVEVSPTATKNLVVTSMATSPHNQKKILETQSFSLDSLPALAFDHLEIIKDYLTWKSTGSRPGAVRPALG